MAHVCCVLTDLAMAAFMGFLFYTHRRFELGTYWSLEMLAVNCSVLLFILNLRYGLELWKVIWKAYR